MKGGGWDQFCRCSLCGETPGTQRKLLIKTTERIRKLDAMGRGDMDTDVSSAAGESTLSRNTQENLFFCIEAREKQKGEGWGVHLNHTGLKVPQALWMDANKSEQRLLRLKKKWAQPGLHTDCSGPSQALGEDKTQAGHLCQRQDRICSYGTTWWAWRRSMKEVVVVGIQFVLEPNWWRVDSWTSRGMSTLWPKSSFLSHWQYNRNGTARSAVDKTWEHNCKANAFDKPSCWDQLWHRELKELLMPLQ